MLPQGTAADDEDNKISTYLETLSRSRQSNVVVIISFIEKQITLIANEIAIDTYYVLVSFIKTAIRDGVIIISSVARATKCKNKGGIDFKMKIGTS